jgi:5-methylcytosine-specific restriction endonuclease McrA
MCLGPGVPHYSEPGKSRCQVHTAPSTWGKPMPAGWAARRAAKLKATPNCEHCGAPAVTVDHIQARAFGGSEDPANLASLCRRCADRKDHQDRERGKGLRR